MVMKMEKIIRPVFTLELNHKIIPSLVLIGKYDGTHSCLTTATTADKILIHSPHKRNFPTAGRLIWSESNKELATLNINQTISALAVGTILPNDNKDMLIIGTTTHILVYNVHDNKDIFYKECPDGVKAITVGIWNRGKSPIIMVGGNSSIYGYDHEGNELFWTAVGDVVTSLILMDYNRDGQNELIVSSDDFNIRIFKGDQIITEFTETEVVTNLKSLSGNRFAYSVSNGTIGVYEQDIRFWRVKSKYFATSMQNYDLLGESNDQLITGWSNGKIDCRSIKTGEVLFKDNLNAAVAGIVEGDYRSVGKNDIICVSVEGEVRGYTTSQKTIPKPSEMNKDEDTIRELLEKKKELLLELKHYENNTKFNENVPIESFENSGVIPANTKVQISLSTNLKPSGKSHVVIDVATNNSVIIKAVVIFAEGIFKGETHVVHPPDHKLQNFLSIPLFLEKDIPVDIHIKTLVGYQTSIQYHVFEMIQQLPRFSMYCLANGHYEVPKDYVEFKINERLQRICLWINQNFLLPIDIEIDNNSQLKIHLKCLRDNSDLVMIFESNGKSQIYAENMGVVANIIQSLVSFLKLENLESKVSFIKDEEKLRVLLKKLSEIQDVQVKLGADVADQLGHIRALVIQAEDSRRVDLNQLGKYYTDLYNLNKELINGFNIRLNNYNEGLETMKEINSIIQKASKLRGDFSQKLFFIKGDFFSAGQNSANMIKYCRIAIKDNNIEGLLKTIQTGEMYN